MINIQISPPIKISGLNSVKIKTEYNQQIINYIKTLTPAIWNKEKSLWETSIDNLSEALDTLTYFDDIKLEIKDDDNREKENKNLTENEIKEFKIKPFKHQIEAVNYGIDKKKWLNLFSMGLGKSASLIYEAETLKRRGLIEHCLIICGVDSLRQQWKKSIKEFSNESVRVLGEKISKKGNISYLPIKERAKELKEEIKEFFIIINIAAIRYEEIIEAFKKSKNKIGLIAVDEIHRCNNKNSSQGHNLLKLKSEYQVGMSGSLLTNNPVSCYLPLAWTENDKATLTAFKSQYCEFGGFGGNQIIGYKNLDILQEELKNCSLRKTFEEVRKDMPEKTVDIELVELDDANRKFYEAIEDGIKEEADKIKLNSANLLALTTRLRQATSNPQILTSQPIISSKIDRAKELIEDLISSGEKVIVMDMFKPTIEVLADSLKEYNPLVVTGDYNETYINNSIEKFKTDPEYKVLLGTNQKVGTGFDFPNAHYLIMLSTPWTYSDFSQNCDRIYRLGSNENIFIKVLLAQNTIDERVWEIVNNKKELSDYLIDGKISAGLQAEMLKIINEL